MRIAVCDDDRQCRARVLSLLHDYAEQRQDRDVVLTEFPDPKALLLAAADGAFDIYILDIVMPEMDGIALGRALRDAGMESRILYLTSSEEYALPAYGVRAYQYLLKPVAQATLFAVLDELFSLDSGKKPRNLIVKTKTGTARLSTDRILYATLSRRAMVYHLDSGRTVESTTLRIPFTEAAAPLLEDKRFVLCGASLAVNLQHITMVENEAVVFLDAERIFLSKRVCRELRAAWSNFWVTEGG